jgi:glycosyltransferase involved in cell wall biosynthesis
MRIFIGFTEIAGFYNRLHTALVELGVDVTYIGGSTNKFAYESARGTNAMVKSYEYILARRYLTPKRQFINNVFWRLASGLVIVPLFIWALWRHDVFILVFGTSFLKNNLDLPILKFFGKRVICCVYHGSEARPPYLNGTLADKAGNFLETSKCARLAKVRKARIARIEKYATVVVGAPFTSHFLENKFINFFHLGNPCPTVSNDKETMSISSRAVRILHSPSNPVAKGTAVIRETIRKLMAKGHDIDFVEVIGQANAVVLSELKKCDFVIDQLYSDTPMAGFAMEAAAHGKPAVIGGYGWNLLKTVLPPELFPPGAICHPDRIEETIERLITDRQYCEELGNRARAYVNGHWSARMVAQRYLRLARNEIPLKWWCDPRSIVYVQGMGLTEGKVRSIIRSLIAQHGHSALQCGHRPELEQALIDFANSSELLSRPTVK